MKKYAQKNIKAISSFMHFCRRTPPGVRGLKLDDLPKLKVLCQSHPTRGAWIEIHVTVKPLTDKLVAPHPGCVD